MAGSNNGQTAPESASQLYVTAIPLAIYAAIYVFLFLVLRRKFPRYYTPRSYVKTLPDEAKSPKLKDGLFNWFGQFWAIDDTYIMNHHSLDGYLYVRFIKVAFVIVFVGCLITWPVLFPVNATGGGGKTQLSVLSMSNVANYWRYFAHAGCGIIFFSFVLYMITRESIYYINIRQAYLMSPLYASRISSRTVLYTSVPENYMNEGALRRMLGDGVRKIWFATDCKELTDKVDERDSAAMKLEGAEVALIKTANKNRLKQEKKAEKAAKKNGSHADAAAVEEGARSGDAYITAKDRPTHKTKFLIGKKVDTIDWCRAELQKLIPEVDAMQAAHRNGEAKKLNSVFVEFDTLVRAQEAFQSLTHHQALHMSPRFTGMTPGEVIWTNLRIKWWERVIRGFVSTAIVVAMIVFWAIPVAFVGVLSNIKNLIQIAPFLGFLNNLPGPLFGLVSGLLPTILLAVLIALVPVIIRALAKLGGAPTRSAVELWTQKWFFTFCVVQGFLVVTLSSSASAVGGEIANNPARAISLLSSNLPDSSNFYISYFVLLFFGQFASVLLALVGLLIFLVLSKLLDKTPRKMYNRWINLSAPSWGTLFGYIELYLVIAICYSIITPLVMGFAVLAMAAFYICYKYNMLYVADANIDCKGLLYTNALQHIFVGMYLSQLCLIGLFAIGIGKSVGAIGPLILMIIMLVVTILYQISLNEALAPMLTYLPKSLAAEEDRLQGLENGHSDKNGDRPYTTDSTRKESDGIEAYDKKSAPGSSQGKKPSFFAKWLRPDKYCDYETMRKLVPKTIAIQYSNEVENDAFFNPAITSPTPILWIPRDRNGLSRQAVAETGKVIPISDDGAILDDKKNKIVWDAHGEAYPPIYEEKVYY